MTFYWVLWPATRAVTVDKNVDSSGWSIVLESIKEVHVIALVTDRNQHPKTNLALNALWICFTGALYTLCGWAPQASLACDRRTTFKSSSPNITTLLLLPSLALDSCIRAANRTGFRSTIDALSFLYWLSRHNHFIGHLLALGLSLKPLHPTSVLHSLP